MKLTSEEIMNLKSKLFDLSVFTQDFCWYLGKETDYTEVSNRFQMFEKLNSNDINSYVNFLEYLVNKLCSEKLSCHKYLKEIVNTQFNESESTIKAIKALPISFSDKKIQNIENYFTDSKLKWKTDYSDDYNLSLGNLQSFSKDYSIKSRELLISLISSLTETKPTEKFESIGLPNKNNTCYINSTIQSLAHCDEFEPVDISIPLNESLSHLLKCLRSPNKQIEECYSSLDTFLSELFTHPDETFNAGVQNDPKMLMIFLIKLSEIKEAGSKCMFRWSKQIEFSHEIKKRHDKKLTKHLVKYPVQITCLLTVNTKDTILRAEAFKKSFSVLISYEDNNVLAHCEDCKQDVYGKENVDTIKDAKYIIFVLSDVKSTVDLNEIETLEVDPYNLELKSIINRIGRTQDCGHNYAICKEKDSWVVYNDKNVSKLGNSKISSGYMFFYKVTQIN